MSGWTNYSVGHAIEEILSNEISLWLGGYKSRKGADGNGYTPMNFTDWIEAQGGYEAWANTVSSLSRKEIDLLFLRWCIELEQKRGFADDKERKAVLARYNAKIKATQARTKQAATVDGTPAEAKPTSR